MSTRKSRIDKLRSRKIARNRREIMLSPVDSSMVLIIVFLLIFGLMAVFSAGAPEGIRVFNNPLHFAIKHTIFLVLGIFILIKMSKVDYKKLRPYAVKFAFVVIGLLLACKVPGIGVTSYGATRWIAIGPLTIQPSELASLSCVLLAASALADAKSILDEKLIKYFALIGIMTVLVLVQPKLSVAILLGLTCFGMMVVAGVSLRLLTFAAMTMLPVLYYKIAATPYQLARITGWLNPWADAQGTGYNLIQSWYAVASGGFFGVGFGCSKQKLFWLPFGYTDFIYAVIAEELGFIGSVLLIGMFLAFIHKGFQIASRCGDRFGQLLAFGITFIIGAQGLMNMSVALGVMPATGVTLPLISYGGSSLMITLAMLGILLNISRKRIRKIYPDGAE